MTIVDGPITCAMVKRLKINAKHPSCLYVSARRQVVTICASRKYSEYEHNAFEILTL